MVNRKRAAALITGMTLAGIFSAVPAVQAQGVLEQMENDVANIAAKTKSAVVTIFDRTPRAVVINTYTGAASSPDYRVERVYETPEELKKRTAADAAAIKDLGATYANLDHAETGARAELNALRKKYADKHPLVVAQQEKVNALKKQIAAALAKLKARKAIAASIATITQYRIYRNSDTPFSSMGTRTGSGFSIGDGYIVTTADVLDGMKDPLVMTDSGIQVKAQIVGVNKDWNVGLLKLMAQVDLPALKLGDSAKVAVGHFAISVGEQSGQSNSVALLLVGGLRTDGVSAGGHFYPNLIQIAGTVGAGISGAPLVNSRGEVIGIMAGVPASPQNVSYSGAASPFPINTTIIPGTAVQWNDGLKKADSYQYAPVPEKGAVPVVPPQNYVPITPDYYGANFPALGGASAAPVSNAGFAVPINALKPILEELKTGKPIAQGWIGIDTDDVVTTSETGGIVTTTRREIVRDVYPNSAASVAGIMPGDVVISINGKPIHSVGDTLEVSHGLRVGDRVKFRYIPRNIAPNRDIVEIEMVILARPAVYGAPLVLQKEKN